MKRHPHYDNVFSVDSPIFGVFYLEQKLLETRSTKTTLEDIVNNNKGKAIYVYDEDLVNGIVRYAISDKFHYPLYDDKPVRQTQKNYKYVLIK